MAAELLVGAALGAAFGELLKAVLEVKHKTRNFEHTLAYLSTTLRAIDPVIKEIEQHNEELGQPKEELLLLIKEMEEGTKLVYRCSKINKFNFPARIRYQEALAKLVVSLERFFRFDMQARTTTKSKKTLLKVTRILSAVKKMPFVRTEDTMGSSSDSDPVPLEIDVYVSSAMQPNDENEWETDSTEEATESETLQSMSMQPAEDAAAATNSAEQVLEDIASLGQNVSQAEAKILKGPHEDSENNFEAIEKLRSSIQFLGSKMGFKSHGCIVYHANNLLKLEVEFKQLLSPYSKPVEAECLFDCLPNSMQPSSGSPVHESGPSGKNPSFNHHSEPHNNNDKNGDAVVYTPPALIPPRILPLLHDLAQQIVEAGHRKQLLEIYRDARSSVLEESLQIFGVEKLNNDDVQKLQCEILEAKVGNWIHLMRIAVKLLFAGERKVCDQIFEGFGSLNEQCFAEVTTNSVSMLLSFGEAIAKSKRSPERLFLLLDMYELMRELHSEIETLFKGKACTEIREAAIGLAKQLAQTCQETFRDYEAVVVKDAPQIAVIDGIFHPLTSYVVKFLFDYLSSLKQLFHEFEVGDNSSQLASATKRIIQALQTILDRKSKQYRRPALKHLVLMNNVYYTVRSVRRSEAKYLLGDDWVRLHSRIVNWHGNQYITNAWAKTLQCLSEWGIVSSSGFVTGASRAVVKDSWPCGCFFMDFYSGKAFFVFLSTCKCVYVLGFKTFNDMFEELHQNQSQWTVPDTNLRKSLSLVVAGVFLPAYRSFVKRSGYLVESQKNSERYTKYTAEDLDRMLGEFFEGKNMNESKR